MLFYQHINILNKQTKKHYANLDYRFFTRSVWYYSVVCEEYFKCLKSYIYGTKCKQYLKLFQIDPTTSEFFKYLIQIVEYKHHKKALKRFIIITRTSKHVRFACKTKWTELSSYCHFKTLCSGRTNHHDGW